MSFSETSRRTDDSLSASSSIRRQPTSHHTAPKSGSLPPIPSICVHSPPTDSNHRQHSRRARATEPAIPFPRIDFGGDIDITLSSLPALSSLGLPTIAQKDESMPPLDMLSLRQRLDAMTSNQERVRLESDSTITSCSTRTQQLSPRPSWSTFGRGSRV